MIIFFINNKHVRYYFHEKSEVCTNWRLAKQSRVGETAATGGHVTSDVTLQYGRSGPDLVVGAITAGAANRPIFALAALTRRRWCGSASGEMSADALDATGSARTAPGQRQ